MPSVRTLARLRFREQGLGPPRRQRLPRRRRVPVGRKRIHTLRHSFWTLPEQLLAWRRHLETLANCWLRDGAKNSPSNNSMMIYDILERYRRNLPPAGRLRDAFLVSHLPNLSHMGRVSSRHHAAAIYIYISQRVNTLPEVAFFQLGFTQNRSISSVICCNKLEWLICTRVMVYLI